MVICIQYLAGSGLSSEEKKDTELVNSLLSNNKAKIDIALSYISANKPVYIIPQLSSVILKDVNAKNKEIALSVFKSYPQKLTTLYSIEILKNTNSFLVKKEIIDYLSGSIDRQVVPPIINELESPFFIVRESACLTLKKIGDDRMFPFILNLLENSNPVYKVYGLEAIYYLYDMRFYNHLINILKDENKSIRYYVLRCIDSNKLKEALPNVRNTALTDESAEVRVKAIQILENLTDKDSMQVLLACLKDANREIRFHSSKALLKLLFKTSAYPVSLSLYSETDDEIKTLLIKTLIGINDGGGYKGIKKVLLEDNNYRMRVFAAYSLACIKNVYSAPILLEGRKDSSKEVRAEIYNSLGFYNDKSNVTELLIALNDDAESYVRSAALFSIRKMRPRYAILPLFDRYNVENDPVMKEQIRFVLRDIIKETN